MAKSIKFLFRPLDNSYICQYFAENLACIPKGGGKLIACDGLNPPIGYESVYTKFGMKGHSGIDYPAPKFTPIYSSQDGIVEEIQAEESRGLGIGIITDRKYFCKETGKEEYFKIRYWHQCTNLVKKGDKVTIGQVIGLVDNTGYSSGDHLHFEIKPVNVVFKKDGSIRNITNILQTNGFYGAVDPFQYMQDIKASDFTKYKSWQERLTFALLKYLK